MIRTSSGSSGSTTKGNTKTLVVGGKRPSPAKRWCFTWCNYPEEWEQTVVPEFMSEGTKGYVIGREKCKETGTPHLQGYAEFAKKIRWSAFKGLPNKLHWEAAKGTRQENIHYCTKEGNYIDYGTCRIYRVNIELREWQLAIWLTLKNEPDDRSIYWIWEPDGRAGKTTFQKWIYTNMDGVVVLSGKASDMKNGVMMYLESTENLPRIVLINIPRCQDTEFLSWQGIEEIKDGFFYSPKYKGGMICGANPHVVIFANIGPPEAKLSDDRWKVVRI